MRDHRKWVQAGVASLMLVLASCGAPTTTSGAQVTTGPPAASPTAPLGSAAEAAAGQAAVAAYVGMWQAMARAGRTSDWKSPELDHYATGLARASIIRSLYADHLNNVVTRGTPTNSPVVRSVQLARNPARVLIDDYGDSTNALKYHEGTNRPANSVQRKLFDLATRIPGYGKKETRGGKLDREVLQAFLEDEEAMHAEAARIRAEYSDEGAHRAWALFSKDADRRYLGNEGYPDVLGSQYVYDSKVANHRQVGVGDLVVLRDDGQVFGLGRIQRIDSQEGVRKLQRVCPVCGSEEFDVRRRQLPKYRCRKETCHAEFDELRDSPVEVTQFVAFYGGTWRPLDGAIEPAELKSAFLDSADQNAIRPVDVDALQAALARLSVPLAPMVTGVPTTSLRGGRRPAVTTARTGQSKFREALLKRYGMVCAVTGPCPAEVLQAAHIRRFAEHETHELDGGVLLRADVHLLFDNGLLAVDPDSWQVVLAPSLVGYETYTELAGARFARGPSPDLLREHFEEVTATWG